MERVVPWKEFVELIAPHAPTKATGRRPFPIDAMLRIHFLQQWFGLSDVAMGEALYDVPLYREFAGLGGMSRLPDRVSILRFRHLLEQHQLAGQFLKTVNAQLSANGYLLKEGTAVDATLIAAPSSTKNKDGKRDPEMHQTKKGNAWHFEQCEKLKARIRAKVEHPFRVIKRQFGHAKVRYRGLMKNTQQLHTLFALSNLWMARRRILNGPMA